MTTLGALRALALAVGDTLTFLATSTPDDFPLPDGASRDECVRELAAELLDLTSRTRQGWKKELLELVQKEVAGAIEKARAGDEEGSHQLFVDAEMHFRQYERGEAPKVTFVAGPDGQLTKTE